MADTERLFYLLYMLIAAVALLFIIAIIGGLLCILY